MIARSSTDKRFIAHKFQRFLKTRYIIISIVELNIIRRTHLIPTKFNFKKLDIPFKLPKNYRTNNRPNFRKYT